jgi:HK97 family phage major capsid protein
MDELLNELQALIDAAEVGELTDEQAERMAELTAEINQRTADAESAQQRTSAARAAIEAGQATRIDSAQFSRNQGGMQFNGSIVETTDMGADSEVYTSAFVHYLQRGHMSDAERRAFAFVNNRAYADTGFTIGSSDAGRVVPTELVNGIIEVAKQYAPLLDYITLNHVPGGVKYTVEGTVQAAAAHAEGATITPTKDTYTQVALGGFEITKLLEISDSVEHMTMPAFKAWLVGNLGKAIGYKVSDIILAGTGATNNMGSGISTLTFTTGTNQIQVAASASLTAANVFDLIGLLPGAFDPNAVFIMSKKTFYADFAGLMDKSKNSLVTNEGKDRKNIQGYDVLLDERMALHEAYLGDLSTIHANMPENITVKADFDITRNVNQYLGVAMFDCVPAIASAFVKLAKASS